jgi:hypothetical protein
MLVSILLQTDLTFQIQQADFAVVDQHYLPIKVIVGFESMNNNFYACLFVSEFYFLLIIKLIAMFFIRLNFPSNIYLCMTMKIFNF